jgi:hypothetical protein
MKVKEPTNEAKHQLINNSLQLQTGIQQVRQTCNNKDESK